MPSNDLKGISKMYGIFFGILFGFSAILISLILLSRGSWRYGLSQVVQESLNVYYPDSYVVGDYHELESIVSTSTAVFSVKSKKANTAELSAYCVLIRLPTLIGAQPALFLYSQRYGVRFVGYVIDSGKAEHILNKDVSKSVITYWESQIPLILEKAGVL